MAVRHVGPVVFVETFILISPKGTLKSIFRPRRHLSTGRPGVLLAIAGRLEFLDLLFGFFLGDAVTLLDFADKLFSLTVDAIEVVVSQVAPFLLSLAFDLFPFALNLIPIHFLTPRALFE
mgnify:CR=1 FL=1